MAKHTFETNKDVEEKWKKYEDEYDASFSKMANKAIMEYLDKKLKRKGIQ